MLNLLKKATSLATLMAENKLLRAQLDHKDELIAAYQTVVLDRERNLTVARHASAQKSHALDQMGARMSHLQSSVEGIEGCLRAIATEHPEVVDWLGAHDIYLIPPVGEKSATSAEEADVEEAPAPTEDPGESDAD